MNADAPQMLEAALAYTEAGLSVLPIRADGSKAPALLAGDPVLSRKRRATEGDLAAWFGDGRAIGLAVQCGAVSGGLAVLDFDDPDIFEPWLALVEEEAPGLVARLVRVHTPRRSVAGRPGVHLWARVEGEPIKTGQLARRRADRRPKIEIRGEGAYAVAPPSGGPCHESGRPWTYAPGSATLDHVPTLARQEWDTLARLARSFDEVADETRPPALAGQTKRKTKSANKLTPGNDFNARGDVRALLIETGAAHVGNGPDCGEYWRRPGAVHPKGKDATLGRFTTDSGGPLLHVFTTSWAPFEADKTYSPFAVYTLLRHGGDYSTAARDLAREGFGDAKSKTRKKPDGAADAARGGSDWTDSRNAERLVESYGRDVRYCWEWKKWLAWDGQRWAINAEGEVLRRSKDTARTIYAEAAGVKNDSDRREAVKWARQSEAERARRAMVHLARAEPGIGIKPQELDSHPWLLNVANGTLDLQTGDLRPHRRRDLLTKLAPVAFDPSAKAPRWEEFLVEIMNGRRHLADFLRRAAGYSLTGDVREHVMLFLYGTGRNGKGTFLNTLRAALGDDYSREVASDVLLVRRHDGHPTELAQLHGKRFITTTEAGEGRRFNEALLKHVTGGDKINARGLYEDPWDYSPTHKLWLGANHRPTIHGSDPAIWSRLLLIPFDVSFLGREDKMLGATLLEELPGVLAWAVRGCLEWQRGGLAPPVEVQAAVEAYHDEEDAVREWLRDRCETGEGLREQPKALFDDFGGWWAETKGGQQPLNSQEFYKRLTSMGFQSESGERRRWRRGLALKRAEALPGACEPK